VTTSKRGFEKRPRAVGVDSLLHHDVEVATGGAVLRGELVGIGNGWLTVLKRTGHVALVRVTQVRSITDEGRLAVTLEREAAIGVPGGPGEVGPAGVGQGEGGDP
jgi:hypothetical protein